jgi:hypothetical protein
MEQVTYGDPNFTPHTDTIVPETTKSSEASLDPCQWTSCKRGCLL